MEKNELQKQESNVPAECNEPICGFEESNNEDFVIPRIKVVQALSPERKEKLADEGDIINSLTKEAIEPDALFIPIKQYYSNIAWNPDRDDDIRMLCRSFNGKIGVDGNGIPCSCQACGKTKFDNTKTGRDAQPTCTAYMNFLGFFEGNPMPVVLSFAKTNYNEGKKMLSIAKSLMTSIWSYGYHLKSKEVSKGQNSWYIITAQLGHEIDHDTRLLAAQLFKNYEDTAAINADYEDIATKNEGSIDEKTAAEI